MPNERVQIVIGAQDRASGVLDKIKGNVLGVIGAYAGFRVAANAVQAVIDAAIETEKVYNDLSASIQRHGESWADLEGRVRSFTDSIQTATGVSDEAVAQGLQQLIDYGMTAEQAMQNMKVALDLAVGGQMDTRAAVDLVGKAFVGYTGTLSRYGIILDESIPKAEKFSKAVEQINQRFSGAAEARMNTTAGRIELLNQKWGDLQETLGILVLPAVDATVTALSQLAGGLKWLLTGPQTVPSVTIEIKRLSDQLVILENSAEAPQDEIDSLKEKLTNLRDSAIETSQELIKSAATSEAIKQYNDMAKKIDEGTVVSREAIGKMALSLRSLTVDAPSDVRNATNVMIAGLDQQSLAFSTTGETARLTADEIAKLVEEQNKAGESAEVVGQKYQNFQQFLETLGPLADEVARGFSSINDAPSRGFVDMMNAFHDGSGADRANALNAATQAFGENMQESSKKATDFASVAGGAIQGFGSQMVGALMQGGNAAQNVFQKMGQDFLSYFIQRALGMLLNMFLPGLGSILFNIFDNPSNDRQAMRQGQHFGQYFSQGALTELSGITSKIVGAVAPRQFAAATRTSSGATSLVINFNGPVTSRRFVQNEVIPLIEDAVKRRKTLIANNPKYQTGTPALNLS